MRPDASRKLAATLPKGSMSRALIGSVVAGLVIAGVVIAILVGNSNTAGDGGSGTSALPAGVGGYELMAQVWPTHGEGTSS